MTPVASPPRAPRLPWRAVLFVALGALCAVVVAAIGLSGSVSLALPLGQAFAGAVSLGGGLALLLVSTRHGRRLLSRVLLALAGVIWGGGQLLLAFEVATGRAEFPAVGDAVSGLAAPFAVLGLALIPRRVTEPMQGLRLACEVLMLAAAGVALAWRWAFAAVYDLGTVEGATGLALVTAEIILVCTLLTSAVRESSPSLVVVLAGVALFVAADLVTMHSVARDETWPWTSAAVACLAWPLIVTGTFRVPIQPPPLTDQRLAGAESRRLIVHAAVMAAFVTGMLVSLRAHGPIDVLSLGAYLVVLCGFVVRESVRARQAAILMDRLSSQALVDPLTGLPNRRALTERLDRLVLEHSHEHHQRRGGHDRTSRLSVLTLDLDGFKDVNSRLGNSAGDDLIQAVAERVAARSQSWGATTYRLGGDEFAVLYEAAPDQATALADAITQVVRAAAGDVAGAGQLTLTASVGVAHRVVDGGLAASPSQVVLRSAQALQAAKETGRGSVVVFTQPLAARNQRRASVERRLRERVARGGVDVHFQPIVSLRTGNMIGMEALARWTDDELGAVPPPEFIDVAEGCGLIEELGWQIMGTALAAHVSSGAAALGVSMGVNVSPLQLRHPDFARRFAEMRTEHGLEPHQVVIEVTESSFVHDDGPAVDNLFDLAASGTPIALDDFGTGYSSLAYLGRLPVRIIKFDRTLTSHLDEARTLAIARSVAGLAAELGLDIVVEGIETHELQEVARQMGAEYGQGWLYEKAVPLERLPLLIDALGAPGSDRDVLVSPGAAAGLDATEAARQAAHGLLGGSSAHLLPSARTRTSEGLPLSRA